MSQSPDALESYPFGALLDAVGAKSPTPGGGAVAAAVGALAAALSRMVVSYSLGRKGLADHQEELDRAAATLDRARALLLGLADEDAVAFAHVSQLMRLPEDDPRRADLPAANLLALQPPRASVAACAELLRLMESLAPITNRNLRSDLAVAAILAEAAARASWWNVAINLPQVADPQDRERIGDEARALLDEAAVRRARVEQACAV